MHPLIHQFWEQSGYQVRFIQESGYWHADRNEERIRVAYRSFLTISKNRIPDFYIWNREYVSEEYMLKVIKMKAFI